MKKLFSLVLCFAIIFTFISCNNTNDSTMVSNEISTTNEFKSPNTKKEYYLNLLDDMCKNDTLYNEDDSTEKKLEINSARLKNWVKMIKDIYGELQADLPYDVMEKLHDSEIKWVKKSKEKAEKASSKYEDKDLKEVVYLDNLIESIKDRCYKLVTKYMI